MLLPEWWGGLHSSSSPCRGPRLGSLRRARVRSRRTGSPLQQGLGAPVPRTALGVGRPGPAAAAAAAGEGTPCLRAQLAGAAGQGIPLHRELAAGSARLRLGPSHRVPLQRARPSQPPPAAAVQRMRAPAACAGGPARLPGQRFSNCGPWTTSGLQAPFRWSVDSSL
ncbi:unnamed protein product [Lepidochelys kempii]